MDLQARKLGLIEYLIALRDEKLFGKIETVIKKLQKENYPAQFKPLTKQEVIARAKKSGKDIQAGNLIAQEELEKESDNW